MKMYDLIEKKRFGEPLTKKEIDYFVNGYTSGEIEDSEAAALLMAICINDLSDSETYNLTVSMAETGDLLDLSSLKHTVDKHSSGGVGDKTSLIACPIAAACGCNVVKMAGHSLGYTGGTIDKLESIPGIVTVIPEPLLLSQVEKTGLAIISGSGSLVPASKKFYRLRNKTCTVDGIPLIASSIMSKKLATGCESIVLDVKYGNGAFMKTKEQAEELAFRMMKIGAEAGRKVTALISLINQPIGHTVGNNLEMREAAKALHGEYDKDLMDLSVTIAALMIQSAFSITDFEEARLMAVNALESGKALEKLREMIVCQRGDATLIDHPESFEMSRVSYDLRATRSGYISRMDTERIGKAAGVLGAGRKGKDITPDYSAGIILHKKTGDFCETGETLATLKTGKESALHEAGEIYRSAIEFSETAPEHEKLITTIMYSGSSM